MLTLHKAELISLFVESTLWGEHFLPPRLFSSLIPFRHLHGAVRHCDVCAHRTATRRSDQQAHDGCRYLHVRLRYHREFSNFKRRPKILIVLSACRDQLRAHGRRLHRQRSEAQRTPHLSPGAGTAEEHAEEHGPCLPSAGWRHPYCEFFWIPCERRTNRLKDLPHLHHLGTQHLGRTPSLHCLPRNCW